MWVWVIGLLLLGHAFVHAVWRTYGPKTSWIFADTSPSMLTTLSTTLFTVAAVGFGLAGLALLFHQGWWRIIAAVSAVVSLVLLVIFWRNSLFVGAALDLAVIVTVLWLRWPAQVFGGL